MFVYTLYTKSIHQLKRFNFTSVCRVAMKGCKHTLPLIFSVVHKQIIYTIAGVIFLIFVFFSQSRAKFHCLARCQNIVVNVIVPSQGSQASPSHCHSWHSSDTERHRWSTLEVTSSKVSLTCIITNTKQRLTHSMLIESLYKQFIKTVLVTVHSLHCNCHQSSLLLQELSSISSMQAHVDDWSTNTRKYDNLLNVSGVMLHYNNVFALWLRQLFFYYQLLFC